MQDRSKKTLIGAFVVGALALGVGGVLAFGGTDLFTEQERLVVYFEGFVDGLEPGSPIMFRGVKLGEVESVRLVLGPEEKPLIEVLFHLRRREVGPAGGTQEFRDGRSALEHWVQRGMRAQLGTVSLLTGQLKIDLDLSPDTPVKRYGLRPELPEVPAIPSSRERISEAIQSIPYETLADSLTEIVTGIRDLVQSPDIRATWDRLNVTIDSMHGVLKDLDERLPSLLDRLDQGLESATRAIQDADAKIVEVGDRTAGAVDELKTLIGDYRTRGNRLFDDADAGLVQARETLSKLDAEIAPTSAALRDAVSDARTLMQNLSTASAPGAPTMLELRRSLEKLSRTLDKFAALADLLERQPESLLKGKSGG